jgi:hypothetical protein
MAAVGDDVVLSEGAKLLLERILFPDDRPLWVLIWGGANVLAQVLFKLRHHPEVAKLHSKLRVYAISDQDDTGAWIRQQWPDIFYICSVHGWNQYAAAAWGGISDQLPGEEGGPDGSKVTKEWVKAGCPSNQLNQLDPQIGSVGKFPSHDWLDPTNRKPELVGVGWVVNPSCEGAVKWLFL